ncbi:hypothetical protein SAMN04515647_2216 [Cohaesibacter sp. ES.047]|uniref:hypothetical protein n=1 Tax=Cohaesibacter sp. ES.047 TaxID=1798205 RepID=UPI000BB9060F|nr:hypothetical protein [Cohaesibacter sp. ES.047]SNY91972.1 hypothetical protein SAMN04515647_2216 [Cohaesibacter sp. ES.047]
MIDILSELNSTADAIEKKEGAATYVGDLLQRAAREINAHRARQAEMEETIRRLRDKIGEGE